MKPKQTMYTSPVGTASYCFINKPSTKFKEEGEYSTKLILTAEEAAPLVALINEQIAANETEVREQLAASPKPKDKAAAKNLKIATPPYEAELDDEGNETGNVVFKFKRRASFIKKDGTVINESVRIFGADGAPFDGAVWSGSKIKVAFFINGYYTAIGAGVKLNLRAVQVIEAVSTEPEDAEGYGFDVTEAAEETETETKGAPEAAGAGDGDY